MVIILEDRDTYDGQIGDTNSTSLTVDIHRADVVVVQCDNGTTGTAPAQYTMTQEVYESAFDDYMFFDRVTGETARSWVDDAHAEQMRFTFTNTSGADARYRIVIRSYKQQ